MCPYSMYIYHMHPRQYMSHACTVIRQCLPVIVYETGTCLRRHLSAHLRCEHILVPCFKEKLTNLWNSCLADIVCYGLEGYCYVHRWALVRVEIFRGMATCLPPLQKLIGFAHSRLTQALRRSASHCTGASLPLTLPHPEEKSRVRSLLRSALLIRLQMKKWSI